MLVTTTLPVEARPDLDYVARSEDPNCWVSGSEELRPLETFGWAGSVLPRPPDKLLASDWDTSLSTSLSPWRYKILCCESLLGYCSVVSS